MYTLEGTVFIQSSWNYVRMLIIIISRSGSKLGHVGSKTRSLGQILENLVNTLEGYSVWQHTFVSPSIFSRRAVVSYWRKYMQEVLVNRLGGLSLPRKSVVRLTDRPNMTLDVYRGRKTTIQQQQQHFRRHSFDHKFMKLCQNVNHHNI